ncbi:CRISPR-associated protein Cas5 [uncultured Ilyobacter sp.]|uniref:CRISPR-associated protein Cas5 n=1 Tax=uncultured Ilyobacter sp. TaxID=544433 RepID=UPI002AA63EEB|nr:CRISPR-associated protein Cas5 [uncultured Ilyobacter sp.]
MNSNLTGMIIDLEGKFANFKKFYSNSSSATYYYPPRTTIIGILASVLGREKESYHEEFSMNNLKIGIAVQNELKKQFHTINYLLIKKSDELNGSNENSHTQVPFEVVQAKNKNESIKYRLYLGFNSEDSSLYKELKEKLSKNFQYYPIYFGKTGFSANYKLVSKKIKFIFQNGDGNFIDLHTVIPKDILAKDSENIDFSKKYEILSEDRITLEFKENNSRAVSLIKSYIFSNGKNIRAKVNKFYQVEVDKITENICFME